MPTRAHLPCREPQCPALVPTSGFCAAHRREVEQRRGSAHARGYGKAWQKARLGYLAKHPLCECADCKANGWITPSTVVDHIIPHRGDHALFWDSEGNWMAMSKPHHDAKTAREESFGRRIA